MSSAHALTNVSYVLLGFLDEHPHSGYDIKQAADHSTRFFWQISYGQIYPEFKRLEELGLVTQQPGSRGGRTRNVFRITPKGRAALRAWLAESSVRGAFEMRDEMLLKLFFIDSATPKVKRTVLQQLRLREESTLAELKAMEPHSEDCKSRADVLAAGIKIHETYLAQVRQLERELS